MSSIQSRINEYITEHGLEQSEYSDSLFELVQLCISDIVTGIRKTVVVKSSVSKFPKEPKQQKYDNVSDVENYDDLDEFNVPTLNAFCKENGLKVGQGTKKEIMQRIWRFIEGNSSDEDKPREKKPKVVKKEERHPCSSCNSKGEPCGTSATEELNGCHFCWLHYKAEKAKPPAVEPEKPVVKKTVVKKPVKKENVTVE